MKRFLILFISVLLISAGLAFSDSKVHWGYTGNKGPEHWGDLSEKFAICSSGKNQSPINLAGMIEADLEDIKFNYKKTSLKVVHNGHTIKVKYDEGSSIRIDDRKFKLLQFHFHSPSENHIEGRSFPMEAHLVHEDKDGNLAVIAVMFTKGKGNPLIKTVWEHMPAEAGSRVSKPKKAINVMDMLPENKAYYRFNGSLTTPPCTEGVRWLVLKDPVRVSNHQVKKFRSVMLHDTNRPIQRRNARPVLK